MFDRHPLRVPTKGGSVWFVPNKIIITCQQPPWKIWGDPRYNEKPGPDMFNRSVHLRQLMGRIDLVKKIAKPQEDIIYAKIEE